MAEKTTHQWKEETDNFVYEWKNSTDRMPTLDDVIAECKDIGIGNYKEYAETLYSYMEEA